MSVELRRACAEETALLRQTVLRPGRPPSTSGYAFDAGALNFGAWEDGVNIGCATVFPEAWPGPPPVVQAWRLRGMAVAPDRQGRGIGRLVLAAAVGAARAAGAPMVWANARTAAMEFYLREGWTVAGEEFVTEDTGLPHYPIVLQL
jgi:GNAT superfamily N-acetyltransferase